MAEDHQKASWDALVVKRMTKGPESWGQLAAQLNHRGRRVDTGNGDRVDSIISDMGDLKARVR